jgi:diguanylate cyclase (GGDEF)-like protein
MEDADQLLLWRWSTIVQVLSLAMTTAFFALLARSSRRAELDSWTRAWLFNFLALVVTVTYWLLQLDSIFPLVSVFYLAGKALFVVLLMQGVWVMTHRSEPWYSSKQIAIVIVVYATLGALFFRSLVNIGMLQHSVMGLALVGFSIWMWRAALEGTVWLTAGVAVRGVLALLEGGAYFARGYAIQADLAPGLDRAAAMFLATSSAFDMAVEWLLVLGCVLAVSERRRRELQDANRDLIAAQDDLRRLVDRDPLTALVNRRSLPEIFRTVQPNGALLLFFDLDGFKKINDRHGHAAGDNCLKLFAAALRDSFRPDDHVIRYGGDEFLVVANGLDKAAARDRVEEVRRRMQRTGGGELVCRFSVGMSELQPGGLPETALEDADAQMYKAKHRVIA